MNERLARHYRIPNVYGSHFRRVTFDDGIRGGLLGQASILTVTSYPNRTSPVLRGRVAARQHARRAAAAAAAGRARAEGERRGRSAAVDARADGSAPAESRLRGLSRADGSAGVLAREFRRARASGAPTSDGAPIDASAIASRRHPVRGRRRAAGAPRRAIGTTSSAPSRKSCWLRARPRPRVITICPRCAQIAQDAAPAGLSLVVARSSAIVEKHAVHA